MSDVVPSDCGALTARSWSWSLSDLAGWYFGESPELEHTGRHSSTDADDNAHYEASAAALTLDSVTSFDPESFEQSYLDFAVAPLSTTEPIPASVLTCTTADEPDLRLPSVSVAIPLQPAWHLADTSGPPSKQAICLHEDPAEFTRSPASSAQRQLLKGRESQKRQRHKQRAYSQAQQAVLEHTQAELAAARVQHTELEIRNMLLETLATLSPGSKPAATVQADARQRPGLFTAAELNIHQSQTPISGYIHGNMNTLTSQQISQHVLPAFCRLWGEYMRELAGCLLSRQQDMQPHPLTSSERMQQLTAEASAMMARMLLNPKLNKALMQGRLDGITDEGNQLEQAFYTSLVANLELTEAQVADLMLLRRLDHTKRGALIRERRALIWHMAHNERGTIHPTEDLPDLSGLAAELQMNATEEYQFHYRVVLAVTGILNTKQRAQLMVLCYPYFPAMKMLLDTAAPDQEPSYEGLTAITNSCSMPLDWGQFSQYVQTVTTKTFCQAFHDYLPLHHKD